VRSCLRWAPAALLLLSFVCTAAHLDPLPSRAVAQASPKAAKQARDADYPRLDEPLEALEREPVLLIVEGLEPLVEPAALRARLAALFGRPVVSLADPDARNALATLYCARAEGRASAGRRQGFITLRLSILGMDLWQRIPARSLSGDAASAIANSVMDMLWSDRMASLGGPELLDPFCSPGLMCADAASASARRHAVRRVPESSLVDPWDAREPRFTLLESRRYWTRGDPWGAPAANVATPSARPAPPARVDAGVSERPARAK
jgi:hypothetical protein